MPPGGFNDEAMIFGDLVPCLKHLSLDLLASSGRQAGYLLAVGYVACFCSKSIRRARKPPRARPGG